MSYIKKYYIKNGDDYTSIYLYNCDRCKEIFTDDFPHYKKNNDILCPECAFILNKITEKEYLSVLPISLDNLHAEVIDQKIFVWVGNIHPLDKKRDKLDRRSKAYRDWRKNVLKRDNYKCKNCDSIINLEAHHIKEFSKYKELRFDVDNGITLCKKCHKDIHRKREI